MLGGGAAEKARVDLKEMGLMMDLAGQEAAPTIGPPCPGRMSMLYARRPSMASMFPIVATSL